MAGDPSESSIQTVCAPVNSLLFKPVKPRSFSPAFN